MNRRELRRTRAIERLSRQADVVVSAHAQARASELGFSLDEVLRCVMLPEQTYGSPARYGPDRRVYQRGTVAVVVNEGSRVVVTVLLRTVNDWIHGRDARHCIPC